jgi:hypothetical protein
MTLRQFDIGGTAVRICVLYYLAAGIYSAVRKLRRPKFA